MCGQSRQDGWPSRVPSPEPLAPCLSPPWAPKPFSVRELLARVRAGEVVGREEMLNDVWGYEHFPTTRTVDNHVALLRAKLEVDPSQPRHLITVHGVGYKLVLET